MDDITFINAHGEKETNTVLATFKDNQGGTWFVVPPSVAAMYDRTPRVIAPDAIV